ncbi:SPOR domain-containing protein [Pseudomonas citronellolis]|uniref:SPOR domain-containing protein n=1 Tax=Pseudomonas citronellolis TaxID=53408 RepID=UPI0023E4350E|nr:SPOR domain-containing protein [Pseudomonas citronellolis]MDF3937136.1 SPOR domain-containing protein [Pseudomonas citronellolis]
MAKKKPAPKRGASRYQAPAKKTSVPGWAWLVAGLAIGGFIMFLMKLEPGRNEVRREKPEQQKPGIAQGAKPATPAQQPSAVAVKPKYDFYTLLPGSEVVVPPEAVPEKPQTPTVVSTPEEAAKIDTARAQAALNGQTPPPPAVVKPATPPATQAQPPAAAAKAATPTTAPAPAAKPIAPPAVAATQFFLQAGSFRKQSDADRVRAQVILLGQSARVESGAVRDETWYRVMVGPYSDRAQVSAAQKQLSANGFSNLLLQQRQTR